MNKQQIQTQIMLSDGYYVSITIADLLENINDLKAQGFTEEFMQLEVHSGYDGDAELMVIATRWETDEECRIRTEEENRVKEISKLRRKEAAKKAAEKRKQKERELYEKLKKKFEKSNSS